MNERERAIALDLIYQGCELEQNRFTTDFPITSEVWLLYAENRRFNRPKSILLTPHIEAGVTGLRSAVTDAIADLQNSDSRQISKVERFRLAAGNMGPATSDRYIAANESHLLVHIDFYQLLSLMPLTRWWQQYVASAFKLDESTVTVVNRAEAFLQDRAVANKLAGMIVDYTKDEESIRDFKEIGPLIAQAWADAETPEQTAAMSRLINVVSLQVALALLGIARPVNYLEERVSMLARRGLMVIGGCFPRYLRHLAKAQSQDDHLSPLWQVSCNRPAEHAVIASRKTIKADAAIRVFDTGGQGIRWAVIDSGIDARHPALARPSDLNPEANISDGLCLPSISRVIKTLDFTRLAAITSGRVPRTLLEQLTAKFGDEAEDKIESIRAGLASGRMLDWTAIEPLLEIDHSDYSRYIPPSDNHGTHVAGIIGANWQSSTYKQSAIKKLLMDAAKTEAQDPDSNSVQSSDINSAVPSDLVRYDMIHGICPDIELLDLRVFSAEHESDEFAILGALQYIRFLNQSKDRQYVHGVNLSLSLRHDVRNYACGSTPVCLECDRLVGAGIVVIAAAGNFGYDRAYADVNLGGAYRGQSITDPGNAANVITVGATHRSDPYQYGVSYFSSRGPTGDGRSKPDLVAPGEKILSTVLNGTVASMDGTSMAAPHVSGAAALLLSRNNELMGKPNVIKQVLCNTASDLGRERSFQGAGLLDTLRALQSV